MKLRLLLITAVITLLSAFSQAQTCNSLIIDKAGVIQNPGLIANAARNLINQGADVHVVTVPSVAQYSQYGSGLEGVETFFEGQCPNWKQAGVRKANLFVVMLAPNDHAKNMFLGSYYNGAFNVPSTYSQLSNAYFKNRQWDAGLANALNGTTAQAVTQQRRIAAAQQQRAVPVQPRTYTSTAPVYTTTQTQNADSGISGFAIFMVVMFVMLALAIILYFVLRDKPDTATINQTDTGYRPTYSSSGRSYGAAASSTPVSHTTVINNGGSDGFVTGLVAGELLSRPNYVQPVYVAPSPVYIEPTPSYIPDPVSAPVVDAPDSGWESGETQVADAPDTNFETPSYEAPETPSYDPPSSDFGSSSNDSGF